MLTKGVAMKITVVPQAFLDLCDITFDNGEKFPNKTLRLSGEKTPDGFSFNTYSICWLASDEVAVVSREEKEALIPYVIQKGAEQGFVFEPWRTDKIHPKYLFRLHSKETVINWVNNLRYFNLLLAQGGMANDGDQFKVTFQYSDEEDLINKLQQLGIKINHIAPDAPKDKVGYSISEDGTRRPSINKSPEIAQPGHSAIFGQKAFIWVSDSTFSMTVADGYEVTEPKFRICLLLEKEFDKLNWMQYKDKKDESKMRCISPSLYPELFDNQN
jgi:hypothetical protein